MYNILGIQALPLLVLTQLPEYLRLEKLLEKLVKDKQLQAGANLFSSMEIKKLTLNLQNIRHHRMLMEKVGHLKS